MTTYAATPLTELLTALFQEAGATAEVAATTADVLVEGDLLGHHTHGIKLAHGYLQDLKAGKANGDPETLEMTESSPVAAVIDGHYVLGPYLVRHALEHAAQAAEGFGIGIVTLKRSHHIACLAAYLRPLVERHLVPVILSSDPAVASVAPYGGTTPVYTPNPLAIGIPGRDNPMLIDVSMSSITNGTVNKTRAEGGKLAHPAILTHRGTVSDAPEDFFTTPPGSILPLGGQAFGHKGFALGLMVEALTSALGGFGRKDAPTQWGASATVMVIDPARFGGIDAFVEETDFLTQRCLESERVDPEVAVRLPGQSGLAKRQRYLRDGIPLPEDVVVSLRKAIADSALADGPLSRALGL
ncbi:LDH2 family malate/lactate/ureidoglycolate dehydrogenase [Chromohalobacter marismortui]|uniref:LDH2 family malate/lactate/ureidoglycolate dehydrogenase n=1 Tax=Chromohalobacter marismortui TaxID=42055 RepID=A0A4V3F4H3_9GAMM|nr:MULTISPECIES: Ldh family oxidoreductase [Chromohalobacter]MCI0511181.1 Ldh family oxidoreductase [Chromohalobacter sp.]MCI0593583.1 Ldh family oxidoreductase [Chromohalobacter sp.]TDU25206.1 LDH2 family malate/lactate/ureidoglycolate dehydrogenase [Chromohalobacter marismortui]